MPRGRSLGYRDCRWTVCEEGEEDRGGVVKMTLSLSFDIRSMMTSMSLIMNAARYV